MKELTEFANKALAAVFPEATLQSVQELGSGVTARILGVKYERGGRLYQHALRVQPVDGPRDRLDTVQDLLQDAGVKVPEVNAIAQHNEFRVTAMQWLNGSSGENLVPGESGVAEAAAMLARIHSIRVPDMGLTNFVIDLDVDPDDKPLVQRLWSMLQQHPLKTDAPVLLHGDFWPGNLMFDGDVLVGVVDWEDLCVGPALADLANARIEIRWLWGREAMHTFTQSYAQIASVDQMALYRWDLYALLKPLRSMHRWGLSQQQRDTLLQAINEMAQEAQRELS